MTSTGQTLYRRARSCLPATGRHWRIKGIGKPILIGQIGIASTRGEVWSIDDLMLSQLAPPWLPFAASAFARKSAISPSSQLSSTRCRQRRRGLSISLSSAPCRPTRAAGNHCLPDATGSNCLAISRPAFPPPLRSRRGLGHGHVSGPASFAHYA